MTTETGGYIAGLVSVVIPTYKRFDTLERAIKSVCYQTYKNIEILVVDDNVPGDQFSVGVRGLVESLSIPTLKLVTQNRHINGAAARNAGIHEARGEYIAFLDDDDLWLPEKIEREVKYLLQQPQSVGGVSNRKIFYKDGKVDHVSETWRATPNQNFEVMTKQQNLQTCTLLLKRRCLDETGYFDPKLNRHQEVQLMTFFTQKYSVVFLDQILTVIDCSDVMNRPNAEKLRIFKEDFFLAISPVMKSYSRHKQKLVYAHNMTEVAYAIYRDEGAIKGLSELLKCVKYPSVLAAFLKRYMNKRKGRKIDDVVSQKDMEYIEKCILACEQ